MSNAELSNPPKPRKARISGIERTVQIYDCLAEKGEAVSTYEISKTIKAPMSTIYTIVSELEAREMLVRDANGHVWFGPRMMYYGLTCRAKLDYMVEAKKEIRGLRDQIDEAVQICVRDRGVMIVTDMVNGRGPFRISSDMGTRVPINWAASGRLLLGHLSDEERFREFEQYAKPAPGGNVETDPEILSQMSRDDFLNGYAIQESIYEPAVTCMAAPILDPDGMTLATISIVASNVKMQENLDSYREALIETAKKIQRSLGRRG